MNRIRRGRQEHQVLGNEKAATFSGNRSPLTNSTKNEKKKSEVYLNT